MTSFSSLCTVQNGKLVSNSWTKLLRESNHVLYDSQWQAGSNDMQFYLFAWLRMHYCIFACYMISEVIEPASKVTGWPRTLNLSTIPFVASRPTRSFFPRRSSSIRSETNDKKTSMPYNLPKLPEAIAKTLPMGPTFPESHSIYRTTKIFEVVGC